MRDPSPLASAVRIRDDVVFRDLQGEAIVLNLTTGVYLGLDGVGTRIWHLISGGASLRAVAETLVDEFDVQRPECERDLLDFVGVLRRHRLVEVEPDTGA